MDLKVKFTISLPFERFPQLKKLIEARKTWHRIDATWSYADLNWKPKCWDGAFRVLAVRRKTPTPRKGPMQLDLFQPRDYEFDFRVILTNKVTDDAEAVMDFHHGRGSQEGLIGEAKSGAQMDYIPSRRLAVNQTFTISAMLAHNLGRELQMTADHRTRRDTSKRAARWVFKTLHTLRHNRAARRSPHTTRGQADADDERQSPGPRRRAALRSRRSGRVEVTQRRGRVVTLIEFLTRFPNQPVECR